MKRLAVIAIILLCCLEGYSQDAAEVVPTPADSVGITPEQMTDSLAAFAFRSLGKRYRTGAMGPNLFDCSGFTSYVFSNSGIKLSRTSREQFGDGRNVDGGFDNLQKGDLVFFNGRCVGNTVGHVGIFLEADSTGTDFSFIHAALTGVTVSRYSEDYYTRRYMGARRVLPDIRLPLPDSIAGREPGIPVDTMEVAALQPDTSANVISALETQSAPAVDAPAPEPEKVYHKIKSGDTLSSIARRYGTTVGRLCKLNSISAKSTLRIGKSLRVR